MTTPLTTTPYAALRRIARGVRDRARRAKNGLVWNIRKARVARAMELAASPPAGNALRGSTLFFVPYAGVTPMFAQACVVARTLRERGHSVIFARCFRLFERCPVMDMHQLPYEATPDEKLESCLRCADNSLSMLAEYGLEAVDLRPLVIPEMTERIDDALSRAPRDLLQFEFDGLRFGALSVMDLVLALKISDFSELAESDRRVWLQYLRSCLLSHLIVDRACREWGVGRIVHVNDYSLLLGARTAARKRGVPCYGLAFPGHRNVDLRRYLILSNVWKPSAFKLLAAWPGCRDLPLDPKRVREVAEDLLVRLRGIGSHLYSPGKTVQETDVRKRMGLSTDRKLLVAYTSSLDELIASRMGTDALGIAIPDRPQPFRDQLEWLAELVRYVEQSDDLSLVVRIHPREGANKRESVVSQHLSRLRGAFGGTYAHCRFVWPADPVSSYDLGEAADVVLTSWSTIGLEMARLGAPLLVAFNGAGSPIPQDDFCEWGATSAEFFAKLRELLDRPVSTEQVVRAFRWYSLLTLGTTVDLSDVVPRSDFAGLPPYRTPLEAAAIEQIVMGEKDVCDLNVERLRASKLPQSEERETDELLRQLRRLVHFLMTGEDSPEDASLVVRSAVGGRFSEDVHPRRPGRMIDRDGCHATYRVGDRVYRRYSPMTVRLANLCGHELAEAAPGWWPAMTRFLIVNTDYPGFLDALYAAHPGLEHEPSARQFDVRNASLFGVSDFYPRNLAALGHTAIEVSINNRPLQAAWAREHAVRLPAAGNLRLVMRRGIVPWIRRDESAWMEQILAAQIEDFRPDVILTHSLCDLRPAFWKRMNPHYRLLAGQIASPLSVDIDLSAFGLMLSSLPNFVERFRQAGLQTELFRLAFDPIVLEKLASRDGHGAAPPIDVSFIGSLSPHHAGRLKWLEHVCREVPVQVWGQGIDSLPQDSAIRSAYRGSAWGIEMFQILQRSRISLNHHIEISGPYANNMRLYETTGVGTLLLTDWKKNLAEMFAPDSEAAVYRTSEECVERIGYYLNHETERKQTARAGQQRTLQAHTYRQRMAQLVELVENLL